MKKNYKDFVKFCLVGVLNTGISFAVYFILVLIGVHYLAANIAGYLMGIINSYVCNSIFVFKKKMEITSISKFVVVYGSSLLLNSICLYSAVEYVHLNKFFAQIIVIGICTVYNFIISSLWAFK